jgi:hypothetical protein
MRLNTVIIIIGLQMNALCPRRSSQAIDPGEENI